MKRGTHLGRLLKLLLLAGVLLGLLAGAAMAEEIRVRSENYTAEGMLPDSGELLEEYINKQLYSGGISMFSTNYGESILPDSRSLGIYRLLKSAIENVADRGGSTTFDIPEDMIGIIQADISDISTSDPERIDKIRARAREAFNQAIPAGTIIDALLIDCAYELYWFDKTMGWGASYSISYSNTTATVMDLTFYLSVSEDYQPSGYDENNPAVTTNVSAVSRAVANAREVVLANEGKSDLEKLTAYRDYICANNSYNYYAADDDNEVPYGDPWQMIYVFDGDSSTNVVCEGYSKAFRYLCELSSFDDDGFACYLMTGDMYANGQNPGGHMWNVVSLNGCNYLVDVTNYDSGFSELFMCSNPYWGSSGGYDIDCGSVILNFVYDGDTINSYSDDQRTLGYFSAPTYDVILTEGEGYILQPAEGSVSPVIANGSFSFTVEIENGYMKGEAFAVKANGVLLQEQEGLYTIADILSEQVVTVEGVVPHIHTPQLIAEIPATCDADGVMQHYFCEVCQERFWDETGLLPVLDETALLIPAGHDFTLRQYDSLNHWFKCSRCEEISSNEPHGLYIDVVGDAYYAAEPTCQRGPLYSKSCEVCGAPSAAETFTYGEPTVHRYTRSNACDTCGLALEFVLPAQLRSIDAEALAGNPNLTYVRVPDSVTTIGSGAFSGCGNLAYVYIGKSVTGIADDAFDDCPNVIIDAPDGSYAAEYAVSRGLELNLEYCPPLPDIPQYSPSVDDLIEDLAP